jgi:hypothetical protein
MAGSLSACKAVIVTHSSAGIEYGICDLYDGNVLAHEYVRDM